MIEPFLLILNIFIANSVRNEIGQEVGFNSIKYVALPRF